jgi:hypothetical protein
MRPDLVEEHEVVGDLLAELGRVGDLALVEVLVLEWTVEALDDVVGVCGVVVATR